jgi:exodeoxyribonuclease VII large subunit
MTLSISDFNKLLKTKLPNDIFLLKGEVRQPKISGGHMYLTLKDDTSSIKCIIWKSKLINPLIDGINIEVKGCIDYYCNRGEVNFIISSYKSINTAEDTINERLKLKNEFEEKGYFNKKNLKLQPDVIKNILIITSQNGAAIHDFIYTINNNKSLLNYTIIDVQVQGNECPKQIIEYLNNNNNNNINNINIDLVVITRGGGSAEDLNGFNNKELIETVYKRNYVLLSAIGHMVDTTLLDYAADISCPTPSLAAQYIIDHNKKYINNLSEIKESIKQDLLKNIKQIIFSFSEKLNEQKHDIKQNIVDKLNYYKYDLNNLIKNNIFKLEKMRIRQEQEISIYQSNSQKLNYNEFKKITNLNKPFTIVWNDIIINVNKYNNING